jgi:hypothetical protein
MPEAMPPDLNDLAKALQSLVPEAPRLDRDRLMFRAGQAQVRRWHWPALALVTSTVAACLGLVLLLKAPPPPVERIVYVKVVEPAVSPSPPAVPTPPQPAVDMDAPSNRDDGRPIRLAYHRLQQLVLRVGLDSLPPLPPPAASEQPMPLDMQLERGSAAETGSFSSLFFPSGDR